MSLVVAETLVDYPLTPEHPTATDLRILACMAERQVIWHYSLLSSDRTRMICIFDAPDAESVRESYKKGGGGFKHIWTGELIFPEGVQPPQNESMLKIFEGTFPGGFTQAEWDEANHHVLPCYAEHGVEWVQSYVSRDRTRVVCELNSPDAEIIRTTHRKFDIPCDRIWSAIVIKP
jgi:hypothetical protein